MSNQRLQNLYIARLTTQERPCFICNKFTGVVLTSADNSNADWFYICRSHLGDFNFCTKVGGPKQKIENKKPVSNNRAVESDSVVDLVSSIGSAWKSWKSKKPEDDKKEDDKKEDEKKEEKKEENKKEQEKKEEPISPPTSPTTQQPIRFIIQKDYFYLRQREYMKKIQMKQASEKLKTLQFPEVPQTLPTLK